VGEATIPMIQLFNRIAGVDERDFVTATKATFKLGIEFTGWRHEGHRYFHPFGRYGDDFGASAFHHHWLRAQHLGDTTPLSAFSLNEQAAYAGKFGQGDGDPRSVYSTFLHAYHFDATLYGQYLRGLAEQRGVIRREGMIAHVERNAETGHIAGLHLDDGGVIEGISSSTAPACGPCCWAMRWAWGIRTGRVSCPVIGRWPCPPLASISIGLTRVPPPMARAGNGAFRCSIAWATAWSIPRSSGAMSRPMMR
jgi:hypothetical protein